jgi:hypothetical protein
MWVTDPGFHFIRRFRLKMSANRMLKKLLRPKRKGGREGGRKEGREGRRSVAFCSTHKIFLT